MSVTQSHKEQMKTKRKYNAMLTVMMLGAYRDLNAYYNTGVNKLLI